MMGSERSPAGFDELSGPKPLISQGLPPSLLDSFVNRLTQGISNEIVEGVKRDAIPLLCSGYREGELEIKVAEWGTFVEPAKRRWFGYLWFRRTFLFHKGKRVVYLWTIPTSDRDTKRLIIGLGLLKEPVTL
jgi:hypothetical protein